VQRSLVLLVLALAVPSAAGAAKPYEVTRPGDNQMSCEQLTTEINALNGAVQTAQQEQVKRENRNKMAKGVFSGIAGSALSAAPSLLGAKLGGGMTQMVVSGALQSIQSSAATAAAAPDPEPQAAKPALPEQQRLEHIGELYRTNGC